jgi:carboxyl-terminal processing protease
MSKQVKAAILVLSSALVLLVMAGGLGVRASSNEGAYRQLGVYSEVLSRIRSEYVEEPNVPQVTDGALHGLLESLDANSSYLSADEYREYKSRREGRASIGATISKRFGYAAVISVLPGGPADKAGMTGGDIIEAIEGRSTREMSLAEVRTIVLGQQGSNINLSIVRPPRAAPQKVTVTRDAVTVPAVEEKMLENGIGYLKAEALTKGKAAEIGARIKALQHSGVRKLILDLRDDSDGDSAEGVAVANLFLNHGTITYLQGQKHPRETFTADPQKAITNLPLVVLVNRGTAGPAEIAAAAILENARGDVVGDKTFGLGSVQKLIEIPDGSALILTVAKYYSPSGKAIQDTSVTPNVQVAEVPDDSALPDDDEDNSNAPPEELKKPTPPKEDEQLKRAIELLKGKEQKAA